MTTPCSLGLPNLNSPSPPPSFLVLFLLPLWLICVSFNLVPCADSLFFLRFRYDGHSDYWQSHKSGSPASFLPSSPCCLFPIFLATSTLFILLVHTYIHIHTYISTAHSGI